MMRNLLVLSVLIIAVVTAQQLPQDVSNEFFEGRSGDLLLKPHLTRDQSLMMFLKAADNQVPVPTEKLALTQSTVSDLLSHLVGTAPLNPQVDRTHFPKKGFFNNPKANLMFVLDSTATAPAATEELLHTVASESYPDETITALTSIMTGTTASKHGIIGDAWLNKENGETVHAFESWCPSRAGSRSATLQDVFGLAYGGRSLVLSFSSKLDFARALSTKPFLLKPTSPNHGFYWNGKAFQSVYSDKTKYTADLKTLLVSLEGTPASVEGAQVVISVDGQQVALDLNEPEVLAFVAEFAYASYLVNLLTVDEELKALVADDIPDFFSFGFATLKDLQNKYGRDSSQMKAVASLVDYALKTIVAKLNALYNGKVLSEAIFLGSNEEAADVNRKQIIEKTKATLVSQLADEEHFEQHYPEVYLSKEVQPEQKEEACSFLQQVLSPADVEVVCLPDPSEFRSIRADAGNSTGDGTVDNEIAIFQIVLWTSVVLILMTLWAAAVMFTIDASKDTMIYRDEIHIKTIQ